MGPAYKVFFKPTSGLYKQKTLYVRVCPAGRAYRGLAGSAPNNVKADPMSRKR